MNLKLVSTSCCLLTMGVSAPLLADHAWADYHWARTTNSFDLVVINSTTNDWDPYVSRAIADWSQSNKINMIEDANGDTSSRTRRKCNAPDGMVRICNLEYGQNGWLGIAGISLDSNGHIITGYTKMNDTYFNMAYYSGDDWKQSVTCQELGHDIGLGHQDEDFNNQSLFSCMDYQDPPYEYPNNHDYDQLSTIYNHTDSYNSYAAGDGGDGGDGGGSGCNAPPGKGCNKGETNNGQSIGWGRSIYKRGNAEVFMRIDPDGTRHLTHVTWAIGFGDHDDHSDHEH